MTAPEHPHQDPPQDPPQEPLKESTRTRLAAELRSAYESGARVKDLAVVSHRAQSEVRRLLREAGVTLGQGPRRPPDRTAAPRPRAAAPPTPVAGLAGDDLPVTPPARRSLQRRVAAKVVRVGAETSFAVVPEWRPAIAIPVATEVLLAVTGLPRGRLLGVELTVLVHADALHDRELAPSGWRPADQPRGSGL